MQLTLAVTCTSAPCTHRQHIPPRVALVDVIVWVLGTVAAVAYAHGPAAGGSQCLYRDVGPSMSLCVSTIGGIKSMKDTQRKAPTAGQGMVQTGKSRVWKMGTGSLRQRACGSDGKATDM